MSQAYFTLKRYQVQFKPKPQSFQTSADIFKPEPSIIKEDFIYVDVYVYARNPKQAKKVAKKTIDSTLFEFDSATESY